MESSRFIQFSGLFTREIKRFLKVPYQTLGAPIVSTFLYLLIFGVNLGSTIGRTSGESYLAFLIPGLVSLTVVKNSFENATSSIIASKYTNELQDLRITPLSKLQINFAQSLACTIRGWIVGAITLSVGVLFLSIFESLSGLQFHTFYAIISLLLSGMIFGQLGISIGMSAKSFEQVGMISSFVITPLTYLGGIFFPIDRMHATWQLISKLNPLFYVINAIRYGLTGTTNICPLINLLILCIFFVITYTLSILSLKKGSNYFR